MDNALDDARLRVCSYNSDFSQNQLSFMQILNMAQRMYNMEQYSFYRRHDADPSHP